MDQRKNETASVDLRGFIKEVGVQRSASMTSTGGKPLAWLLDMRRVFMQPEYLAEIVDQFWARFAPQGPVQIGGMEVAAIPLLTAILLAGYQRGHQVNGFIIEGPTAGGHNAPPRGQPQYNDRGEPEYGERDLVDLDKIRELGLPFWLAGGVGSPEGLRAARAAGAAGIQVGTLFAYSDESGLTPELKRSVLRAVTRGEVDVFTDPRASPTGFPFKIVRWNGAPPTEQRERLCDLGYLRVAYRTERGTIGFRCAAEPVESYVAKGGRLEDTEGRQCLCNGLMSDVGLPQVRENGVTEPPLLTSGDDLPVMGAFLAGREAYAAADVIRYLDGG